MSDFNYYDELKNGLVKQHTSYLNNHYINSTSPEVEVFKLDKKRTVVDSLYNEAKDRIYLNPFKLRALHLDNSWKQILGGNSTPYRETQEEMSFVCNFDNMVKIIREKKNEIVSSLSIEYTGNLKTLIWKKDGFLYLKVGDDRLEFNLEEERYNSFKKVRNELRFLGFMAANLEGENLKSNNINDFEQAVLNGAKIKLEVKNNQYENITDVIEIGDLILTNKNWLYEILEALPGGDLGWDYATYILKSRITKVDKLVLPKNYIQRIKNNGYGLKQKYNME